MPDPENQLLEDRALRDAARKLVRDDFGFIRESLGARSVPLRIADRLTGGAQDIAGEAALVADENRKALGAGLVVSVLGVAAFLYRDKLIAGVEQLLARSGIATRSSEPDAGSTRSDDE